jgi:hypothetical protein
MRSAFTLLNEGTPLEVSAAIDGDAVRLEPEVVKRALGWELKPQGLCKDERCVPVRDRARLLRGDAIDLHALAELLGQPLAIDVAERVACLGTSAQERGAQLASLDAPDFTLPDLDGKLHSLSDYRGKKILFVAYASW